MSKRLKILASAYACNPEKGSDDGCGWNIVKQLTRFGDVAVITLPINREAIERALEKSPMPDVTWHYFDTPAWINKRTYKGQRAERLHYQLWQLWMYPFARKLHREHNFDVVHHITYTQYWTATYLIHLNNTEFVWGPVGGGESAPKAFKSTFPKSGKRYEAIRDIGRITGHMHPWVHLDARRATLAVPTTRETERRVRDLGAKETVTIQSAGLSREDFDMLSAFPLRTEGPFRFMSIGRMLHWKGFHLGLMAFAEHLKTMPDSEYWFIGDGAEMDNLNKLATELGISDNVRFLGRIPRAEVLSSIQECDAMVHPSLHEAGGWVTLESAAAGRPVICLDLGGPGEQVTPESGFAVPANTPEQAIHDIAAAMTQLASDPDLKTRMAEAGRKRVEAGFLWDRAGDLFAKLPPYNSAVNAKE